MSQIKITITDKDGFVEVKSTPSFGQLMQQMVERPPTAGESYAISMLNKVREMSNQAIMEQGPKLVPPPTDTPA